MRPTRTSWVTSIALAVRWVLAATAASVAGCATDVAAPVASAEPPEIYLRNCSACHGERGDGRGLAQSALVTPPRDFTTEEARTRLSREYMIAIVRDGRPHTAMVGRTMRLTQQQIEATVDFIRTAFMPPEPGTPRAQGRATYLQSCASCHGDRGQGSRAAPALSRARARPDLTPERMAEAIARGSHGRVTGFASRLSPQQIDAVVDYVRGAFIEIGAAKR